MNIPIKETDPKLQATIQDEYGWGGWSNKTYKYLEDLADAVAKIKDQIDNHQPVLNWNIIDADNLRAWVSSKDVVDHAIRIAKANFSVDIPIENIMVGEWPETP